MVCTPSTKRQLLLRHRDRVPAHGRDRHVDLGRGRGAPQADVGLLEPAPVAHRRPDAVEPGALVGGPGCRERRARELLGVEAVGAFLRRVAPDRQGAGQRLGLEAVAETGQYSGMMPSPITCDELQRAPWLPEACWRASGTQVADDWQRQASLQPVSPEAGVSAQRRWPARALVSAPPMLLARRARRGQAVAGCADDGGPPRGPPCIVDPQRIRSKRLLLQPSLSACMVCNCRDCNHLTGAI